MRVDDTTYDDATRRIIDWARGGESRYVCVATVHMVMESHDSDRFRGFVNAADLVTADGMPLVWSLRAQGVREASRVYGPHLTESVVRAAEREHLPVGFYGGTPEVLRELLRRMRPPLPTSESYAWPPPLRRQPDEDEKVCQEIRSSGARIVPRNRVSEAGDGWLRTEAVSMESCSAGAAFDF
jgi:N-acetylglucosaminyldiphosphoundecaprenol N-acetyl-beta-D-mannosaminyltransferase